MLKCMAVVHEIFYYDNCILLMYNLCAQSQNLEVWKEFEDMADAVLNVGLNRTTNHWWWMFCLLPIL